MLKKPDPPTSAFPRRRFRRMMRRHQGEGGVREDVFTDRVATFVADMLERWKSDRKKRPGADELDLGSLDVRKKEKIPSGRVPIWIEGQTWTWREFPREIDVALGRAGKVEEYPFFLPLVAIENKCDGWLQTPELDAKNAIYAALKEQYPCLLTCLIMEANLERRLGDSTALRNCRHFDIVLTAWQERDCELLRQAILAHLEYAVEYWRR